MKKIFAMILVLAMVCSGVGYAEEAYSDAFIANLIKEAGLLDNGKIVYTHVDEEDADEALDDDLVDGHYVMAYLSGETVMVAIFDTTTNDGHTYMPSGDVDSETLGTLAAIFKAHAEYTTEDSFLVLINDDDTYVDVNDDVDKREALITAFIIFAAGHFAG